VTVFGHLGEILTQFVDINEALSW